MGLPAEETGNDRYIAELGLLGACLSSASCYRVAAAVLHADHFSDALNARTFAAIAHGAGAGLDHFPLTAHVIGGVRDDPNLAEVKMTASQFVARALAHAIPAIGVAQAARLIRFDFLDVQLTQAHEARDLSEIQRLSAEMAKLAEVKSGDDTGMESIGAVSERVVTEINEAYQRGQAPKDFAPCGLSDLSRMIGGWRRKRLYIIAGRPGMGKSTLALSSLLRTAIAGHGVMLFSLEMSRRELTEMALCDLAWSSSRRIEYRDIGIHAVADDGFADKFEAICEVRPMFNSLPLAISDRGGLTVAAIRSEAMEYAGRLAGDGKRLDVICIDHLGLIRSSTTYRGNKVAETEEVSADLKVLAKDMDCAVVALCQLSRQVEGREDKRPTMGDLRWSGAIEQDADVIMFPYRPEYYLKRKLDDAEDENERLEKLERHRNQLELLIEKHRGGPTGVVELFCDVGCAVVRDGVMRHG